MASKPNRSGLITAVTMSLLLIAAVFGIAAAAQPRETIVETVTLTASQDNTLYETELGNISNGMGQFLFAGNTGNSDTRRAVVAFDLSAIPVDATVLSATLSLNMSKTVAGDSAVSLHRLQQAWGEGDSAAVGEEGGGAAAETGDATWLNTFFDTGDWTTPGGDFDAAALATTTVGGVAGYDWTSAEFIADVQAKVADPSANFGWLLLGDESVASTAKRFDSVQNSEAANRPMLTITYEAEIVELLFSAYAPVVLTP